MDPNNFDPKEFKMVNLLRQKGTKAAQARYIKSFYEPSYNELMLLASGNADDQLKEGYRHHPRKNVRKLIEFFESVISACDQIAAEAKVLKKPRAKKVKPAEDQVKKLKFKLSDDKLGIASVPPAQLIKAQGAVVFNTKTRKIGYYIAMNSEGLTVKNSSLSNFTQKSIQKTLRKPAEQLKEFKELNTQRRFETWFEKSVKTTETALNGRISVDVVILKVFK
jgi:type III secretory pathway component EscR